MMDIQDQFLLSGLRQDLDASWGVITPSASMLIRRLDERGLTSVVESILVLHSITHQIDAWLRLPPSQRGITAWWD